MNNIWYLLNDTCSETAFVVDRDSTTGHHCCYDDSSSAILVLLPDSSSALTMLPTQALLTHSPSSALPLTKCLLSLHFQCPIKQICCQSEDTWNELSSGFLDLFNTWGSKITISSWREKCERSKPSTPTTVLVFLCWYVHCWQKPAIFISKVQIFNRKLRPDV